MDWPQVRRLAEGLATQRCDLKYTGTLGFRSCTPQRTTSLYTCLWRQCSIAGGLDRTRLVPLRAARGQSPATTAQVVFGGSHSPRQRAPPSQHSAGSLRSVCKPQSTPRSRQGMRLGSAIRCCVSFAKRSRSTSVPCPRLLPAGISAARCGGANSASSDRRKGRTRHTQSGSCSP